MNDPKRISIVGLRSFPAEFKGTSGIEFYVQHIVQEIVRLDSNISFDLYTRNTYDSLNDQKKIIKNVHRKSIFTIHSKVLETSIYSCLASIHVIFDESRVVWYQGVGPAIFSWIPMLFGKKVIVTIHSLDWKRKKWSNVEKFFFSFFAQFVLKFPVQFTVVSSRLKKDLRKSLTLNSVFTPPGIMKRKRLSSSQDWLKKIGVKKKHYLLFLGRVVPEKRLEWLLEKFSENKNTVAFAHHDVVIAGGDGNIPWYLEDLKKRYSDQRVKWLGYVFGEEKRYLLSQCSCLVLPSELEGSSISLMEALSEGINILIADRCIDEELHGLRSIFTFHVNDIQSFMENLKKVITLHQKMEIGKDLLQKFNWQHSAETYIRLFKAA